MALKLLKEFSLFKVFYKRAFVNLLLISAFLNLQFIRLFLILNLRTNSLFCCFNPGKGFNWKDWHQQSSEMYAIKLNWICVSLSFAFGCIADRVTFVLSKYWNILPGQYSRGAVSPSPSPTGNRKSGEFFFGATVFNPSPKWPISTDLLRPHLQIPNYFPEKRQFLWFL